MDLQILHSKRVLDLNDFIEFWSQAYYYKGGNIYDEIIDKPSFTEKDYKKLYEWKNGMHLSGKKETSLDKILERFESINSWKINGFNLDDFFEESGDISAVWKLFLLNLLDPQKYPIYDQHVHRAFNYITDPDNRNEKMTDKISDKEKEDFYLNKYLPFIEKNDIKDLRKFDKAMYTYGKFLKSDFKKILTNNKD